MEDTPERAAWLEGYEAGLAFGADLQPARARSWGEASSAAEPVTRTPELFAAWLNGYGHGIHEAAGCIPGHHLTYAWDNETRTGRTELIRER